MDEVEKYMMSRLYQEVFCPETTDDEKKDLVIQKRIRFANKGFNILAAGIRRKAEKLDCPDRVLLQRFALGHH